MFRKLNNSWNKAATTICKCREPSETPCRKNVNLLTKLKINILDDAIWVFLHLMLRPLLELF